MSANRTALGGDGSTLLKADLATEVAELKRSPGGSFRSTAAAASLRR